MYKTVIVDDELAAIKSMKLILENYCPDLEIVGTEGTVSGAVDLIREKKPDIAFLDVELQGGNGFQILEATKDLNYEVIFITAHNHHALRAFKFSSIDYLQKPIDVDELIQKINKLLKRHDQEKNPMLKFQVLFDNMRALNPKFIIVPTAHSYESINADDIVCFARMENGSLLSLTNNQELVSSSTLNEFQLVLENSGFFRVNEDYLIQLNKIQKINRFFQSKIKLFNGLVLNIDKSKVKLLQELQAEFIK